MTCYLSLEPEHSSARIGNTFFSYSLIIYSQKQLRKDILFETIKQKGGPFSEDLKLKDLTFHQPSSACNFSIVSPVSCCLLISQKSILYSVALNCRPPTARVLCNFRVKRRRGTWGCLGAGQQHRYVIKQAMSLTQCHCRGFSLLQTKPPANPSYVARW